MLAKTIVVFCAFASITAAAPAEKVGFAVENFTLKDTAEKARSLSDYKERKAVVVVFLGTECPVNNAYLPVLAELHKKYDALGVTFLAVNANRHDTPERVAEHAKKNGIPFPVLKDTGNKVADQLRAERTPEAVVIAGGKVVYRGRIDDRFGVRHRRDRVESTDLANALDDVVAGKAVRVAVTEAEGCFIAKMKQAPKDGAVTYTKHVARILQKNCQECHRPGQIAPMSLLTYENAVDWSDTIREVVAEKRMPPWHADGNHGSYANDRSLPKADRESLLAWIDGGMPKGDDKDMPTAAQFGDGWLIGKPDAVFQIPQEYTVPAKAEKNSLKYQYFFVPTNFTEDKWIQAVQARAGNSRVVHHILVYVRGADLRGDGRDGIGNGLLVAYAPGDNPGIFPDGVAKKIPKGAMLIFQVHYTPIAREEKDRSSVGFVFAKKPAESEAKTRAIASRRLSIPPGEENYKTASTSTFAKDTLLVSLLPHMHLRGKSFEYVLVYPDGKKEVLLNVPQYDFNWQTNYRFAKPIKAPAGSRIDCTAVFDNSTKNKSNPDPTATVRWGEQTWQEMMIGFVDYVSMPEPKKTDK